MILESTDIPPCFVANVSLRYILVRHPVEGSHNGSAAVLKTADRKVMQVRVLSPPPLLLECGGPAPLS